ncbi:CocE/NonD family hydrolase [Massilia sp. S19_KUP03_FR1]|uniref:CocE/NonD family hydrolase n=1 Tax=Massilia sp. S19_KUP03_FR1 TaxID=3025503 RepID=UPI002FCD7716
MRFVSCRLAFLSLTLLLTTTAAVGQPMTPAPGPYAVGLHIVQQFDASRGATPKLAIFDDGKPAGAARPMQTLVWYPAQASGAAHVRYLDYLQSSMMADDFTLSAAALANASKKWEGNPAAQATMLAVRDAKAASGTFPVVIYAPSFNADPDKNADLCEYLASHGYIVLASASRGAHARGMTDDLAGAEAQATDILWLASYAATVPGADLSKLAVAGFSWGGLANVIAASHSGRVKALVSLDGSVRYYPQLLTGSVTPANTAVPILSIGSRPPSLETLNEREKSTALSFLNKMVFSDVYLATMQSMEHRDFSASWIRLGAEASFVDYSRAEVTLAHNWTARYVRAFLDAYLKQDAAGMAFLKAKPETNGVPTHMMDMKVRPASAILPSKFAFTAEFKRRQFKDAGAIYDAMQKSAPDFKMIASELNTLGYEMLGKKHPQGAIELFKLGIRLEPRWGAIEDSLGEAYEAAGEPTLALAAYERALVLTPDMPSSAARVKALRKAP